jgi:hypothetical protein
VRASAISSIKRYMCSYDVQNSILLYWFLHVPPWTGPRRFSTFKYNLYGRSPVRCMLSPRTPGPGTDVRPVWWTAGCTRRIWRRSPPLRFLSSTRGQPRARYPHGSATNVVRQPTPTSERSHAAPPGHNDRTQPPTHSSTERGTPPAHSPPEGPFTPEDPFTPRQRRPGGQAYTHHS